MIAVARQTSWLIQADKGVYRQLLVIQYAQNWRVAEKGTVVRQNTVTRTSMLQAIAQRSSKGRVVARNWYMIFVGSSSSLLNEIFIRTVLHGVQYRMENRSFDKIFLYVARKQITVRSTRGQLPKRRFLRDTIGLLPM